ncbi:MAG TPA: DUF523 domain-containing protein [Kofleriaceae bacterium]|nr:DUF523 domain-containing protein [Kofleriaceae bacterium]
MSHTVGKDATSRGGARRPEIKPRVAVSACLAGDRVRYDGGHRRAAEVDKLAGEVELVRVCPELELGLGVPRPPIHLVRRGDATALIAESGRDLSAEMARFSASRIAALRKLGIAGYVLKARSPSCAVTDAAIRGALDGKGPGLFAAAVMAAFPGLPVADEADLAVPGAVAAFVAAVRGYARRTGQLA